MSLELFGDGRNEEMVDLQLELWQGIRRDLTADIKKLRNVASSELGQDLHKIFGYSSNAALLRLGMILKAWEEVPQPDKSTLDFLPLALETASLSILEMEKLFPHLQRHYRL